MLTLFNRVRPRWFVVAAFVMVTLLAGALPAHQAIPTAHAQASAGHGARLAKPAVVRIIKDERGTVVCKYCSQDGSDITFPQDSGYVYRVLSSGSGAFISPDGYILTAAHVVDKMPWEWQYFENSAINDFAQSQGVSTDQAAQLFEQLRQAGRLEFNFEVSKILVFLSTGYLGPQISQASVEYDANLITSTQASATTFNEKDTAVVKVQATDMPYLQIASDVQATEGYTVTAVAFPADADVSSNWGPLLEWKSMDNNALVGLLTPTIEDGKVIAKKPLSDGTMVYETSGISQHGSSGGPIIDEQGRLVGIASSFTGETQRVTYWIPGSVVIEQVRKAGVANPAPGKFMTQWTKAINEYDATGNCHWTNAAKDLKTLQSNYPNYKAVDEYVQTAQNKVVPGECVLTAAKAGPNWGLIIGGVVLFLVLVGAGIGGYLFWRSRKAKAVAPGMVPGMVPGMPIPGMPMQGAPGGYPGVGTQPTIPTPSGQFGQFPSVPQTPVPTSTGPMSVGAEPTPYGLANVQPVTPVGGAPQTPQIPQTPQPPQTYPTQVVSTPPAVSETTPPVTATPVTATPATSVRWCAAGHVVSDPNDRFCPECGQPVLTPPEPAHAGS